MKYKMDKQLRTTIIFHVIHNTMKFFEIVILNVDENVEQLELIIS
jgi:hypothetical protein